jgi:hypothetical protein
MISVLRSDADSVDWCESDSLLLAAAVFIGAALPKRGLPNMLSSSNRTDALGSLSMLNLGDHHRFAVLNNKVPRRSNEICRMSFHPSSLPL